MLRIKWLTKYCGGQTAEYNVMPLRMSVVSIQIKNTGNEMDLIIKNFKWVMAFSGVLTTTMFYGLFAPQEVIESMFGASYDGVLETLIIRSWSSLIGLIGIILIYGAINEKYRVFCVSIAAISKAIFVTLVLIYGQVFLSTAAPAILLDSLVVILTLVFIIVLRIKDLAA